MESSYKNKFPTLVFLLWLALVPRASAQGSGFTYQGRLNDAAAPANGIYDLQLTVFDAATNGNSVGAVTTLDDLSISNGLFTVTLDPGMTVFDGSARWLQIAVRAGTNPGPFTSLSPRQPLTPTPYALRAANFSGVVTAAQLPATVARLDASNQVFAGAVQFNNLSNQFSGLFTGDGGGLTNVTVVTNLAPDVGQLIRLPNWISFSNNYPITILAVGDSLAVPPSMTEQVARRLQERFGANGFLTDSYLSTEPYPTNFSGAVDAGPDSDWCGRYHKAIGPGAGIAWGSVQKPNGIASDQVQLFWVQTPDGGNFDLQIMVNGGAWTTIKSLSGYNPNKCGAYTNVTVNFNYNRFRVINTANVTNSILFHGPYYSGWGSGGGSCGVRYAAFGFGGIGMDSFTNVPAGIKDVILTNLNPALIISFNLEAAIPEEEAWLPEYFRWLNLCRGSADIVVVGCYDFGPNLPPRFASEERRMWYTNAVRYGCAYFDLQTASGGFYNMYTNGFLWSYQNPHPNLTGQIAMGRWFEERFDFSRYWLVSDKNPPYKLYLRSYDSTNSPFGIFHSDASGSSSVYVGGTGVNGFVAFGGDGSYLTSALFGNQSYTFLNAPTTTGGPYFQHGGVGLGNFLPDGTLFLNYGLKITTGLTNASVSAARLAFWDANKNLTHATASGPVPVNADGSATTPTQALALVQTNLVTMTANSTATVSFNSAGRSETVYNPNPATLPSLTITLPPASAPGQIVRYATAGAVTSVTVSGTVGIGAPLTTLPANGSVAWQAINSSGEWVRLQ